MRRTLFATLIGLFAGVAGTAGLLAGTHVTLAWWTAPRTFAIEHGIIYLGIVLGAGFGALAGSLIGLGGAVDRVKEK